MCCPSNTPALAAADRCGAPPFADKDIAAVVSHGTFEAYLKIREKMREETLAEEMRAEMERRIALERERASAAGSAADSQIRVALAKEHIVESILTLACPRCKQAFVDFDGCFALQCGRCRAAFCAYCLADCGRDAHAHVGACEEGNASIKATKGSNRRVGGHPATVYGTRAMFDVSQKRRRCKHLALYLERHDETTRARLLREIEPELRTSESPRGGRGAVRQETKQRRGEGGQSRARGAARAAAGGRRGRGAPGADERRRRGRAAGGAAAEMAARCSRRGPEGAGAPPGGPGGRARRQGPSATPGRSSWTPAPGPGFGRASPARTAPGELGPLRREREAAESGGSGRRRSRRRGARAGEARGSWESKREQCAWW